MVNMLTTDELQLAIKRAGGPARIGEAFGISSQAVSQWRQIPVNRVAKLATMTGLPPHELRPDVFPKPEVQ